MRCNEISNNETIRFHNSSQAVRKETFLRSYKTRYKNRKESEERKHGVFLLRKYIHRGGESCEKVDAIIIEALKRTDYPQSG